MQDHARKQEAFLRACQYVADNGGDVVGAFGDAEEINARWEKSLPEFRSYLWGRAQAALDTRRDKERAS